MNRKIKNNVGLKIGIYIRVSTEEPLDKLEKSIKKQEERLLAHVSYKNSLKYFGKITHRFIERAKFENKAKRPEFERLLKLIKSGDINFVLVTELSKITRSIGDLSNTWQLLQQYGCGFQSLRESFDETTVINDKEDLSIPDSLQLDENTIVEQSSLTSTEERFYNDDTIPFGYKFIPKKGCLDVDKKQAEVIKTAFQIYLNEESLLKTSRWLNQKGYKLTRFTESGKKYRLDFFTRSSLQNILQNKVYTGTKGHKENNKFVNTEITWKPIVSMTQFLGVQEILIKNKLIKE